MTWDQALVWIVIPVIGGLLIAGGRAWLSRHIPMSKRPDIHLRKIPKIASQRSRSPMRASRRQP